MNMRRYGTKLTISGQPSPWISFGPARHISANVLSDDCVNLLKAWIEDCREQHSICNTTTQSDLPARLLKVERLAGEENPTTTLCAVDVNEIHPYVALSHSWAVSRPIKTTSENLLERQRGIPWKELPEAYRDTIILSLQLRLEYIWIDSLCIVQGDRVDWEKESPKMGVIYAKAHVVFAAHGPNLCLKKELPETIDIIQEDSMGSLPDHPIYVRRKTNHEDLFNPCADTTSYLGRAWCFQERLFASRILHFGGS